jgi:hypothetical protein
VWNINGDTLGCRVKNVPWARWSRFKVIINSTQKIPFAQSQHPFQVSFLISSDDIEGTFLKWCTLENILHSTIYGTHCNRLMLMILSAVRECQGWNFWIKITWHVLGSKWMALKGIKFFWGNFVVEGNFAWNL